jgi:hypothetical protein
MPWLEVDFAFVKNVRSPFALKVSAIAKISSNLSLIFLIFSLILRARENDAG